MPKKTIYDIRGVLTHISEARTGTTRKEEPYAARTLFLNPQDGGTPIGFDFYRQANDTVWVLDNFKFQEDDLVQIEFTIQGGEFKTRNGNLMPNNKLRVWKIASLNQNGRVTAKKHQQPQDESDDEQDVPF